MPISDRAQTAVLTSLSEGVWTVLSTLPVPVERGFDTLDVEWLCDFRATVKTANQVADMFPLGTRFAALDFWLRGGQPERLAGNVWKFKAHYEGRITKAKPCSIRGQSNQQTMQGVTVPGYSAPLNVRMCQPSVTVSYCVVGMPPRSQFVGAAASPVLPTGENIGELLPQVAANFWAGLSENYSINIPNGWLVTDLDSDTIAGAEPIASYVTETWQFYHMITPNG
jgi:hypothetical protein